MSRLKRHLTGDEIGRLLDIQVTGAQTPEDRVLLEQTREHLNVCEECKRPLSAQNKLVEDLRALPEQTRGDKACVPESEILELAAGVLDTKRSPEVIDHCTTCFRCGDTLKQAVESFREGIKPEESAVLANLSSSALSWQRALAARLTADTAPRSSTRPGSEMSLGGFLRWPRWALAAVAALAIAISYLWLPHRTQLARVNGLLAQAYSEGRSVELRLPGARYAPLRVERGAEKSRQAAPPPLLEAEAIIAQRGNSKQTADWLVAGARADLLEWNYDAAIHTLRSAEALAPDRSAIQIDLATAYFERAQASGYVSDFGAAVESLSRALETDPKNQVAIFNRAIAYEKLSLYSQAKNDWDHYLSLDPSGDWSNEARERLARVEQRLKEKKDTWFFEGPISPGRVATVGEGAVSDDLLDSQIEDYQRIVLENWAPELVMTKTNVSHERAMVLENAVRRISYIMVSRHGDAFLQDLLLTPSAGEKLQGPIKALALAISANESGHEEEALRLSQEAEAGFTKMGNLAGVARSQFEIAYAMQFSSKVDACERDAEIALARSNDRGYRWLQTQALIEWGFCANMSGNLAVAAEKLQEAMVSAKRSGYEESLERAMVGEAVMQWQRGSASLAWSVTLDGLQRYWSLPSSAVRGSSFYGVMDLIAEETRRYHLQEAVIRETMSIVDSGKDQLAAAQTRYRLAGAELNLNHYEQAEADLERSLMIFRSAPSNVSTLAQQLTVSVNLAKAEMQSGQFQRSWDRLQTLQLEIDNLHDNLSLLDFYSTMGEVCRHLGNRLGAEAADTKAIMLFRTSLEGLDNAGDRLTWFHEGGLAYRSLVQLRLDRRDIEGALRSWEEYRDLVSAPRRQVGTNKRHVENIAGPQRKIVTYSVLPEGLYAWLQIGNSVHVQRLDSSGDQIRRLETLFIEECSSPFSDLRNVTSHSQQLYQKLIAPFDEHLVSGDTIVVEPDEELGNLPFNALMDHDGEYFGSQHNLIVSVGSTGPPRQFLENVTNRDPILLVVLNGGKTKTQISDPLAEDEVKDISSLFEHASILGSTSLPPAKVMNLFSQAAIVHYAGHSRTTVWGGELSILDSPEEGRDSIPLRSKDIIGHDLARCHLVVLSACQTDVGAEGQWWDRENLALAFLNAGVHAVVASRWQVDSNATTMLMKEFYSQLLAGQAPDGALRLASSKVMASRGFLHPYYWASFAVLERV